MAETYSSILDGHDESEIEDLSPGSIHTSENEFRQREARERGENAAQIGDGLDAARAEDIADFAPWGSVEELEADDMQQPDESIDGHTTTTGGDSNPEPLSAEDQRFTLQSFDDPDDPVTAGSPAKANSVPHAASSDDDIVVEAIKPQTKHKMALSTMLRGSAKYAFVAVCIGGVAVVGLWQFRDSYMDGNDVPVVDENLDTAETSVNGPNPSSGEIQKAAQEGRANTPKMMFGEDNGFTAKNTKPISLDAATLSSDAGTSSVNPDIFYNEPADAASSDGARSLDIQTDDINYDLNKVLQNFDSLTARFEELAQSQKTVVLKVEQNTDSIDDINARLREVETKLSSSLNAAVNAARVAQTNELPTNINKRRAPSLKADVVKILKKGETVTAIDATPDGNWLLLDNSFWIAKWVASPAPSYRDSSSQPNERGAVKPRKTEDPKRPSTSTVSPAPAVSDRAPTTLSTSGRSHLGNTGNVPVYTIASIQPGTAWLKLNGSGLLEVHEGDRLKGYGLIVSIYQEKSDEWVIATEAGRLPVKQPNY